MKPRFIGPLVMGCGLAVCATDALAAAQRTFVASYGSPANTSFNCSLAKPCRAFGEAIGVTNPGGEVIVLDSAGYGPVTITQSVSIIAPLGIYAGISVFSGTGVTITAGPADKVVLRGITVNGQGGDDGIRVNSGKEIHIEDCTVANMNLTGVYVNGGSAVHLTRITAHSNGWYGVEVEPGTVNPIVTTLADSQLRSNGQGGFVALTYASGLMVHAALTRVTASGNGAGFVANSFNLGSITMTLADSVAIENASWGVQASGTNTTAVVSGSTFVRNSSADLLQSASATFLTAGNNALTGRGAGDISGVVTLNPPH